MQNEPKFPHFSPKNEDHNEKRTQTNPILTERPEMMQAQYLQRIKKIKADWPYSKQSKFLKVCTPFILNDIPFEFVSVVNLGKPMYHCKNELLRIFHRRLNSNV
jgi:hypothetical protein